MSKIFTLSGPIQTAKTTKLLEWAKCKNDVDGILAPIIKGERHLLHISSFESRSLERPQTFSDQVRVGRFVFSQKVFLWAHEKLNNINGSGLNWLILDEIGPLELQGKGLEPAITSVLKKFYSTQINILMVVREGLEQKVLDRYLIDFNEVKKFNFP